MSDAIKFPLVLFIITALCGAILAGLYNVTQEPIEKAKKAKKESSLKEIFGDNAQFSEPLTAKIVKEEGGEEVEVEYFKVTVDGVEYFATIGTSNKCYTSSVPLEIMVGLSKDLKIKKIAVVKSSETPGLGENIKEVQKEFYLTDVFKGKKEENAEADPDKRKFLKMFNDITTDQAKITKDGGVIEALSGATITSRAVCYAVDDAVNVIRKVMEQEAAKVAPAE